MRCVCQEEVNGPDSGDADYTAGIDAKRNMMKSIEGDQRVTARRLGREDARIIA
jgi:hypothetical protein